jgi:hypothetical protein
MLREDGGKNPYIVENPTGIRLVKANFLTTDDDDDNNNNNNDDDNNNNNNNNNKILS